jgi:hypothetical protein
MRVPAILRRDSADALAGVRRAIEIAEAKLQESGARRQKALELGDVAGARRIDSEVATASGDLAALRDRKLILEGKVEVERQELDAERYRAAVLAVERALPARLKAVGEFQESLRTLTLATRKVQAKTRAVFANWPSDIEVPPGAYLSLRNIADTLQRFVGGFDLVFIDRITKRKQEPDFLAAVLEGRLTDVAEQEEAEHAELINTLQHAHDPRSVEDEPEPEPQADESEEAA